MAHHLHHHHGTSHSRRTFFSYVIPGAILAPNAFPQQATDMAARFRRMSDDAERKGLAEPYKGITADGNIAPGLFPIHSTGVSTDAVRSAGRNISRLSYQRAARQNHVRRG